MQRLRFIFQSTTGPLWQSLILVAVTCLSGLALYRTHHLSTSASQLGDELDSHKRAYLGAKAAAYAQLGKRISFPELAPVGPVEMPNSSLPPMKPRLVVIFGEQSCNVCRDREAAFAGEIAAQLSLGEVVAVVSASERRYVAAFARVSGAKFPIFHDTDNRFLLSNQIDVQPLLLLLDEAGIVIAADYPIPGQPEWSEAFHDTCRRLLIASPNS